MPILAVCARLSHASYLHIGYLSSYLFFIKLFPKSSNLIMFYHTIGHAPVNDLFPGDTIAQNPTFKPFYFSKRVFMLQFALTSP